MVVSCCLSVEGRHCLLFCLWCLVLRVVSYCCAWLSCVVCFSLLLCVVRCCLWSFVVSCCLLLLVVVCCLSLLVVGCCLMFVVVCCLCTWWLSTFVVRCLWLFGVRVVSSVLFVCACVVW